VSPLTRSLLAIPVAMALAWILMCLEFTIISGHLVWWPLGLTQP